MITYDELSIVYIATGLLSVAGTGTMVYVYSSSHRMRREYASKLIFIITLMDLLLTLKFLLSAALWRLGMRATNSSFHVFDDNCVIEVLYGSFTSMASQSWNFCWVINFLCVLWNPMRRHRKNMVWYHLFSWTMSLASVVYALAYQTYDKSDKHSCWFGEDATQLNLLDVPLLVYLAAALCSLVYAAYRLWPGLKMTTSARLGLFGRHAAYVIAFVVIWIFPLLNALLPRHVADSFFRVVDATFITGQAVVFAIIRLMEPGARRVLRRRCCRKRRSKGQPRNDNLRAPLLLYGPVVPNHGPRSRCGDDKDGPSAGGEVGVQRGGRGKAFARSQRSRHPEWVPRDAGHAHDRNHGRTNSWERARGAGAAFARSPNINIRRTVSLETDTSDSGLDASLPDSALSRSDDPSFVWSYRFRRDMFDVAMDLRVELALYMLSGLANVMLEPELFTGGSDGDPCHVAVQQTVVTVERERSTKSVLVGDTSDVTLDVPPRCYVEYQRQRRRKGTHRGSASSPLRRLVMLPIDASVPTPHNKRRRAERRRAQAGDAGRGSSPVADATQPPAVTPVTTAHMRHHGDIESGSTMPAGESSASTPIPGTPAAVARVANGVRGALEPVTPDVVTAGRAGERPVSRVDVGGFELTVFQPNSFLALRNAAGLRGEDVAVSLSPNAFQSSELKAHFSEGASSSFFCRSIDQRFVLKTADRTEVETLLKLLPAYIAHLSEHPESLLVRFYGCYAVKAAHAGTHYFILMGNVMPVQVKMTEMYDLKFSTMGRRVSRTVQKKYKQLHQTPLLKDLDFREKYPHGIRVAPQRYSKILMQLHFDTQLLASQGIMDYSLLLGIKRVRNMKEADELVAAAEATAQMRADAMAEDTDDGSTTASEHLSSHMDGPSVVLSGAGGGAGAGAAAFRDADEQPVGRESSGRGGGAAHVSRGASRGRGTSRGRGASRGRGRHPAPDRSHSETALPRQGGRGVPHDVLSQSSRTLRLVREAPEHRDDLEDGYASEDLPNESDVDDETAGLRAPVVVREVSHMQPWSTLSTAPLLDDGTTTVGSASTDTACDPSLLGSMRSGSVQWDEQFDDGNGVVGLIQVGLVDVLQTYDLSKWIEHGFKSIRHKGKELSSVDPAAYAARFANRVAGVFRP